MKWLLGWEGSFYVHLTALGPCSNPDGVGVISPILQVQRTRDAEQFAQALTDDTHGSEVRLS